MWFHWMLERLKTVEETGLWDGHNLKTSTKTKDKFKQESQIFNDYKKTTRKVLQIAKKSINLP